VNCSSTHRDTRHGPVPRSGSFGSTLEQTSRTRSAPNRFEKESIAAGCGNRMERRDASALFRDVERVMGHAPARWIQRSGRPDACAFVETSQDLMESFLAKLVAGLKPKPRFAVTSAVGRFGAARRMISPTIPRCTCRLHAIRSVWS